MKNELENIKKELESRGFKKESEDKFTFENVSYTTMNVNGNVTRKKNKSVVAIEYIGLGGNVDDSDVCDDSIMFFNIFENDELKTTIGVSNFKEFSMMLS